MQPNTEEVPKEQKKLDKNPDSDISEFGFFFRYVTRHLKIKKLQAIAEVYSTHVRNVCKY